MDLLTLESIKVLLGYGMKGVLVIVVLIVANWQWRSLRSKRSNGHYRNPANAQNYIYSDIDGLRHDFRALSSKLDKHHSEMLQKLDAFRKEQDEKIERVHQRTEKVDDKLKENVQELCVEVATLKALIPKNPKGGE